MSSGSGIEISWGSKPTPGLNSPSATDTNASSIPIPESAKKVAAAVNNSLVQNGTKPGPILEPTRVSTQNSALSLVMQPTFANKGLLTPQVDLTKKTEEKPRPSIKKEEHSALDMDAINEAIDALHKEQEREFAKPKVTTQNAYLDEVNNKTSWELLQPSTEEDERTESNFNVNDAVSHNNPHSHTQKTIVRHGSAAHDKAIKLPSHLLGLINQDTNLKKAQTEQDERQDSNYDVNEKKQEEVDVKRVNQVPSFDLTERVSVAPASAGLKPSVATQDESQPVKEKFPFRDVVGKPCDEEGLPLEWHEEDDISIENDTWDTAMVKFIARWPNDEEFCKWLLKAPIKEFGHSTKTKFVSAIYQADLANKIECTKRKKLFLNRHGPRETGPC